MLQVSFNHCNPLHKQQQQRCAALTLIACKSQSERINHVTGCVRVLMRLTVAVTVVRAVAYWPRLMVE